tara:strand:+ start:324 stop:536 length:213 start_codon:yes stop_codon:yes gene_type:complete
MASYETKEPEREIKVHCCNGKDENGEDLAEGEIVDATITLGLTELHLTVCVGCLEKLYSMYGEEKIRAIR